MNKRHTAFCLIIAALLFAALSISRSPEACAGSAYNPSQAYNGPYTSSWLYFNYDPDNEKWLPCDYDIINSVRFVRCPEALQHLKKEGFWKGQLLSNGLCGKKAPLRYWAVGNWLNYTNPSGPR